MMRSACRPSETRRCASFRPKNSTSVGIFFCRATAATLAAGSMPVTGTPKRQKVLKQISVVAGDLVHLTLRAEIKPGLNHFAIPARVLDPGGRVRRKIGVFRKNMLRLDVFLQLHQEAIVADQNVQRKVRLHLVDLIGAQEALAKRRHAEIDEGCREAGASHSRHRGCWRSPLSHGFRFHAAHPIPKFIAGKYCHGPNNRPLNQSVQADRQALPASALSPERRRGVHPNRKPEITLPPIRSRNSWTPGLSPAAPATTISGMRCSSRG